MPRSPAPVRRPGARCVHANLRLVAVGAAAAGEGSRTAAARPGKGVSPRIVEWRRGGKRVAASCCVLAVAGQLAACGSSREGSHLSRSDPTAYPALEEAVRRDARQEAALFRLATRCATIKDSEARANGCATELSNLDTGVFGETATIADLVDESEATPECRGAILRLRRAEEDFSSIGLQLEVALSNPSPSAGLETARSLWSSVKAARHSALFQCR